jgi:Arc/MetJ family transcription regulator
MKTNIDINDALLAEAKDLAARDSATVSVLVEAGLRHVLAERHAQMESFHLRRASFGGQGLQPAMQGQGWDRLRAMAYDKRCAP